MAKATKKQVAEVKTTKKLPNNKKKLTPISDELKHQMIAEAAFYNSQNRSPLDSDPLQDWLLAEQQIEEQLSH